jgi:16S rRNA (adenine1518-N6/adenine1519-N6)-dimethyltransferase
MVNKRRLLGQHMLVDQRILADILKAADIGKNETVCEAGTGNGILTAALCKLAKQVISFEIDRELYNKARKQLRYQNLDLVNADLFRTKKLKFDVFVSNLPYSRSRDALEWLATQRFSRAIVMVQQEFAAKILSKPGEATYRAISALATHCFEIETLFPVTGHSFDPRPMVESVVIRMRQRTFVTGQTIKCLNLLFSKRNRKASAVLAKAGLSSLHLGESRINRLALSDLIMIAEQMSNNGIHTI